MKVIKFISARTFFRFTCFMFWLVTCPTVMGQANQKRLLTPKDYDYWNIMSPDKISCDGNWVSYRLHYEYSKKDTLVFQNSSGGQKHFHPDAKEGKFNAEMHFACISKDTLFLHDLKTGKMDKTPRVKAFEFSANHKFISIILKASDQKSDLEIRNTAGKVVYQLSGLTTYYFDPEQKGIVYETSQNDVSSVEMLLFKDDLKKKTVLQTGKASVKKLLWKADGISFLENTREHSKFYYYNIDLKKLSVLDSKKTIGFPKDMKLSEAFLSNPIHSKDGTKVIVWLKENEALTKPLDPKAVQIWNTKDKLLFDSRKYSGDIKLNDKMAIWNVKEDKLLQITDRELSQGFLSADYSCAFIFNPIAYEPQNRQHCPYDLYIVDLQNGKRNLLIPNYTLEEKPAGSPDGHYLCYAQNGHWWIYSILSDTHIKITEGMPVSFFSEDNNRPGENRPYGIGGWTDDGEIILYDRYDLWKISLDGKKKKRLTQGREIQKSFRIKLFNANTFYDPLQSFKYTLDLKKGFILETLNRETPASGLSFWNLKSGIREMVWENKKVNQIKKASDKDIYMYLDQNFESSPRLMLYDSRPKEIVQSNPQQQKYYWSRNKKIEYDVDGITTKGVLYYPSDFKEGEKYPLVLRIYERQFMYMNDYINPSMITGDGFNIHNYTTQGYFVLLPDINYEFGNLKKSVTNSVLAAVDAVVKEGNVDSTKIGIIGHSFGGYEVDLIITQTNRFATAVSGAPWTDLVSAYLYVGPMFQRPDFFRAEDHQLRIGKSLYEDTQSYLKNSPVLLASSVNTPLLGWAGAEDRHVNTLHSMEFYLALRRLNKEHTLLIYPNEEHQLVKNENAIDLNMRIMQWFNYYLKNGKKCDWFSTYYH
ncbi:S9 family peptidase [Flavobacterium quisquiliarum]|uniref:S9 family peptidase n=1 Tax=Flavobacterium quisquiliarum TaxID=1834436 RepID=A0ABV8W5T0_9FLAO|nr:prolyl oligopeptidase family serine peptidase [Flavobacterium quisquiliarum]MBW1655977.1 prolyl oligopeptidase family serine peptidase [Flavobacterium quisquiliarum]